MNYVRKTSLLQYVTSLNSLDNRRAGDVRGHLYRTYVIYYLSFILNIVDVEWIERPLDIHDKKNKNSVLSSHPLSDLAAQIMPTSMLVAHNRRSMLNSV